MPRLEPFRGLRYHPQLFPDLSQVVAPPYDTIGLRERAVLLARHERNVVRLILGLEPGEAPADPARYADAARTLEAWLADGALVHEPAPALYGFVQRFRDPLDPEGRRRERTGFLGLVGLEPWGCGIHPHERTLAGPKADRLRLLRATRAHLEPVFGLYSDPAGELARVARASAREPAAWTDPAGIEHELWAITDPAVITALAAGLAARDIVVADGHHRYETALAFREEREQAGGPLGHADRVLMFLCAMEDPGLAILPYHRLLAGVDAGELAARLPERFATRAIPGGARELAGELGRGGTVAGLLTREAAFALAAPAETAANGEHPAAIVEREILRALLGWEPAEAVGAVRLAFTTDWQEAWAAVARGTADCAILLPPTPVAAVAAAARAGRTLPQKSTYFYPKIPSGMVFDLIDG